MTCIDIYVWVFVAAVAENVFLPIKRYVYTNKL